MKYFTVLHALALKLACNSRLFSENIYNGNAHQQLTRNSNNVRHLSPRIIFFIYVPVRKQGHKKKKRGKKRGKFRFIYDNLALLNQQLYVLLLVQVFAIDCSNTECCTYSVVCVCEVNRVTSQLSVQPVINHFTRG